MLAKVPGTVTDYSIFSTLRSLLISTSLMSKPRHINMLQVATCTIKRCRRTSS
jgi:hypothetical protein